VSLLGSRPVDSHPTMLDQQNEAVRALELGSLEDASAAVGRLLAVTEATMERRAQLEGALRSRIAIEQAKGILAERYGLDTEEAFGVLRGAARANRLKLHELASRVRPGEPSPPELIVQLEVARDNA
jgi:ANTAR domain